MKPSKQQQKGFKVLCFLLVISIAILILPGLASGQTLKIYCIDVNQGSSTLIVTPNNKSILIDVGHEYTTDTIYDVIKNRAGLDSVNYFVCSHYHKDHYAAIDTLIDMGIEVTDKFYDRDSQSWIQNKIDEEDYIEYAAKAEGKREYLRPGNKIDIEEGLEIECIIANGRVKGEHGEIDYPDLENGYSIGLIISYNDFDFLVLGDLRSREEMKLVDQQALKDVDVYHVNHHGSHHSSCSDFLTAIEPEVSLISSGTDGTYKHPRKETIERLEAVSSVVYQLNKNMDENNHQTLIKNVEDEFIGDLDCDGGEGTILIEVKDDTYDVKILSRGIEKTYNIDN